MGKQVNPTGWPRIERDIKRRANFRCECGTGYDCDGPHNGRCPHIEGNRYPHNGRQVSLRVVQTGPENDWRPTRLVALCLPCYVRYQQQRAEKDPDTIGLEQEGLFG